MGNCCVKLTDCFKGAIGDRDGDGDVDGRDVLLSGKEALQVLEKLSQQLITYLQILENAGVKSDGMTEALKVLQLIKTSANNSGTIVGDVAKIKFPKEMPDINGDGKVDVADYTMWFLQESIHNGYKITDGIRQIVEQLEASGVDIGTSSHELARVEAILLTADQLNPVLRLDYDTTKSISAPQDDGATLETKPKLALT